MRTGLLLESPAPRLSPVKGEVDFLSRRPIAVVAKCNPARASISAIFCFPSVAVRFKAAHEVAHEVGKPIHGLGQLRQPADKSVASAGDIGGPPAVDSWRGDWAFGSDHSPVETDVRGPRAEQA